MIDKLEDFMEGHEEEAHGKEQARMSLGISKAVQLHDKHVV